MIRRKEPEKEICVVVSRPGDAPISIVIENTLKNFQDLVTGRIETFPFWGYVGVCMEDCSMDLFSERLKELRKLSKMTQKEVGERIGMTAQGYAAFERGREPSFEKLKQLSELFAVSSDYLIGLSDSWNPSDQSTLSDYGFSDKTLEDLRRLKEKNDSFTTTPPYFQVVKEKTQDDRYLSDILNDISIESENGLAEILTYVKYMADLLELVDKKDSAFEENAKINDLFSDNSATVILSQAYRNFLTELLDSICLKMRKESSTICR